MSYNINAEVGAIRSNVKGTAILLQVDSAGENGIARRLSVLTVGAQPLATGSVRVRCHNGSTVFGEEIEFLPNEAGMYTPKIVIHSYMHLPLVHFRSSKQATTYFQLH